MAMECLPLMLNDEMVFPYANVLDWARFSVHMRKREIPQVAARLRNISAAAQDAMHEVARRYKRGFVWWRPEGLAYEFTLAALGQRVASLVAPPLALSPALTTRCIGAHFPPLAIPQWRASRSSSAGRPRSCPWRRRRCLTAQSSRWRRSAPTAAPT